MKPFMDKDFLLNTEAARRLYHEFAAAMPIMDYHCHIPVNEIAENRRFENLTQVWLAGDHYKWRAMRACGVDENLITGTATDREKFDAWAAVMPKTLSNPLYHWSHLELRRYFGIEELLSPATADAIWERANAVLRSDRGSVRSLIAGSNVKCLCTTDDPVDDLHWHKQLATEETAWGVRVLPAFRPDALFAADNTDLWNNWIDKLAAASGVDVNSWDALLQALRQRHDVFHAHGCRTSDYGVETPFAAEWSPTSVAVAFSRLRDDRASLAGQELDSFRAAVMFELMSMHGKAGWVQQIHMGAIRNTNTAMMQRLGPNTGYDCIGDFNPAQALVALLDRLEREGVLAKTILYSLNPRDNHLLASICGCFQNGGVAGRMQLGSGWWFNDQKEGMETQLEVLGSIGLLSCFVGMLTDSRSFLSYPRHEYFRRILCEKLGREMERGEIPADFSLVGGMVQDICYRNAVNYFAM